jgi:CRP-like cAMP-binding protein
MALLDLLRGTRIFRGLTDGQSAAVIAAGDVLFFSRGAVVFAQNSDGRDLHVLFEGEVEIVLDPGLLSALDQGVVRPRVLARLGPGQSFGEMALLEGTTRSASAVAMADGTRVFAISPDRLAQLCQVDPQIGHVVFRNLSASMAGLVREQNAAMMRALMRDYFVHVLAEELAGEVAYCDPATPIEKTVTIRDPQSFILADLSARRPAAPSTSEVFRFTVFSYLPDLWAVFGEGEPSGFQILGHVFSLLRDGAPPPGLPTERMEHRFGPGGDRRSGVLACSKRHGGKTTAFFVRWEVKGIEHEGGTSTASVALFLSAGDPGAADRCLDDVIAGIEMPIQRFVSRSLPRGERPAGAGFRVLTVHHRTPEVAHTLRTLAAHGFTLDCHIGIPYGEASWARARMLDHASGHAYYALASTEHPVRPTEYRFDFAQSSFLDAGSEAEIAALFDRGERACDYLTAMTRLGAFRLVKALQACLADGQRLLVYEDGAYVVPYVYAAYLDEAHPHHALLKRAVDEGTLVGAIEVTTAGERRNRDVIAKNGGRAILPVLSGAGEDIKLVYEGLGVAEAVADATSTAFGNLGLPTFSARRVAVLGGNGAIGTRVVEQLAIAHNSTANVFAVDLTDEPFSREIDRALYPHAATRVDYRDLKRYFVGDRCLAVAHDQPLVSPGQPPDAARIRAALTRFLDDADPHEELAISNAYVPGDTVVEALVDEVAALASFRREGDAVLPRGAGRTFVLARGAARRTVTALARGVVFSFRDLARPIRAGIDTVVGATGFHAFREADLDAFLERPDGPDAGGVDMLALASASSKDYEFKRILVLLGRLLALLHDGVTDVDQALSWLGDFYRERRSFVAGPDASALAEMLAAATTEAELAAHAAAFPALAARVGLEGQAPGALRAALAGALVQRLGEALSLRKEVRPDIGLIYHFTLRGRRKALVMLANGFVVNFFARYEKGVKTEYIDPIVTMQLLSLVRLTREPIPPGLHRMSDHLDRADMARFWEALEVRFRPLDLPADR